MLGSPAGLCATTSLSLNFASGALALDRPERTLFVGVFAAPFILLAGARRMRWAEAPWFLRAAARLGPWSYTLYAFHLPILLLILNIWIKWALPMNPAVVYLGAVVVALIVFPFYGLFERHTPRLRNALLGQYERYRSRVALFHSGSEDAD